MGKWSSLKGQVPPAPVDSDYQVRVNTKKSEFANLSKTDLATAYCAVKDAKDDLEARQKEINLELEALQQLLIGQLETDGMDMMRLTSGDSLSIKDEPYSSVEDRGVFVQWIKESGQEDLLSVHYQTLNSMTKLRLESGQNPPPGIKVFIKQSITRRRAR